MAMIDMSVLSPYLSELEDPITSIYQSEYMKDYDHRSKESMKIRASDERVKSIRAHISIEGNKLSLTLSKDEEIIEHGSVWESNGNTIVSSVFPTFVQDWVQVHQDVFESQVAEYFMSTIMPMLGGAAS